MGRHSRLSINKPSIKESRNQRFQKLINTVVKRLVFLSALLSASFIIIVVVFVALAGIEPFISNNDGLGSVSFIGFITRTIWLDGPTFASNMYGAGYLIVNTLYIAFLTLTLSLPLGVLTALFIAKIANRKTGTILRSIVELLAAIPSIVYGLVGAGLVLPIIYNVALSFGIQTNGGNSTLAAVIVLTFMSIPTLTTVSEVAIRNVDASLEEASLALGASKTQTHFSVLLPAAKSGIFSAAILAIGRALGEATAISLVAGNALSGPTFSFFNRTATLTTAMLQGMKETTGLDYDIRFSLGIVLIVVILITNFALNTLKKKVGNVHAQ
ncbi:MAG: phosphate ABC transporter permease subunit PstC [Bacillota bacterium]